MKLFKLILLSAVLLMPSWAWAEGVTTGPAGSPGQRLYTTGILTASSTFTPVTSIIYVTGCGGGGGGAGGFNVSAQGGGGGGSGAICVSRMPLVVTPGTVLTYTIGSAGLGSAVNTNGGIVSTATTIAGLPIGTYTIFGATTAASTGTSTLGGSGGAWASLGGGTGGATAGPPSTIQTVRTAGGDPLSFTGGGAGGGATGPAAGGLSVSVGGYFATATGVAGGTVQSGQAGGGAGGSSPFGVGGAGGINGVSAGVGLPCTVGYGAGGGGGSSNAAGGNGCPGFLRIDWFN